MALPTLMVLVFLLVNVLSQLGKVQRRYQQVVAYESAYWSLKRTIGEAESQSFLQRYEVGSNHRCRFDPANPALAFIAQ